jgi:hypothetical protein
MESVYGLMIRGGQQIRKVVCQMTTRFIDDSLSIDEARKLAGRVKMTNKSS